MDIPVNDTVDTDRHIFIVYPYGITIKGTKRGQISVPRNKAFTGAKLAGVERPSSAILRTYLIILQRVYIYLSPAVLV